MSHANTSDHQSPFDDVPGLSNPARRALREAGYSALRDLDGVDPKALLNLHGFGPKGLRVLSERLAPLGLAFAAAAPRTPEPTTASAKKRHDEPITKPTQDLPRDYVDSLESPRRVKEGHILLGLFDGVTGSTATMWGPSMIGYGQHHYRYESGREGDTFVVGFSPRKAALSLYGIATYARGGEPSAPDELMQRLGKHKRGAACVYVNKLEDIDLHVLRELVERAWRATR